ncbi:protein ACCELERATED CELL DEATH 6-like [Cornus florida]|uniref:protein ACCELERATED CELL DEATH 6-like n=1 Tax=Cornus florida TaxID=4283 RepID=UPI00289B7DE3|nr:protein ACCELERATED CELL DEATH 6-like [Cornus florida]
MGQSQSATAPQRDLTKEDDCNALLYDALKKEKTSDVVKLCRDRKMYPDGPLHVLTIHHDTVLHMAVYTVQADLVIKLLGLLTATDHGNLTRQNAVGNTILHEATAFNKLVPAAQKMLEMAPGLLIITNQFGETALFRAARYGKFEMFLFLDREVRRSCLSEEERKAFYQKPTNNNTVLHTAIVSGHFKLALKIARTYEYLVGERDEDGMTPLHHLARHSSAFQGRNAGYFKRLIYKCVSEDATPIIQEGKDATGWRVPLWENIKNEKLKYHMAMKLAKFLVMKDTTSWKNTKPVEVSSRYKVQDDKTQSDGKGASSAPKVEETKIIVQKEEPKRIPETPLFLATKAGCVDIVEDILHWYPQAVEHIDDSGCTILHIAIKYRQLEIFNMVEKMGTLIKKLVQKTDNDSNSILHMVGEKTEYTVEQIKLTQESSKNLDSNQGKAGDDKEDHTLKETNQNLVLQLQEDLLLFERVKKHCSEHFFNNVNSKGQTAEQLFALKTEKLHTEAKEWLKRTSENSSIVAVLIATVAFAAAYTVPGGSNGTTGVPILLSKPLFVIFTITDVLSLTCTLTSLVIFLSILTSTFRLRDFKHSLPQKLMLGFTFLLLSVSMMMLSFAATIALMIRNKEQWTKISLYTVAFLPVTVFVLSYLPLYLSSLKTFKYIIKMIEPAFPRYTGFIGKSKTKFLSFIGKSKTEVPHHLSRV